MQNIGERLEEARKRKGISIREAAEATKIRGDYLQKFESNSFNIDLPPLYLRGFVRTYAKFLELDVERVIDELDASSDKKDKPAKREHREPLGRVEFVRDSRSPEPAASPKPNILGGADKATLIKYGLIGGGVILAIVFIIVLVNSLMSHSSGTASDTETKGTDPVAVAKSREATFVIAMVDATRVKVAYSDGSEVFLDGKYPLARGEVKTIRYTKELLVTVESPERIRLELNGRPVDVPANKPMAQFRVPFEAP